MHSRFYLNRLVHAICSAFCMHSPVYLTCACIFPAFACNLPCISQGSNVAACAWNGTELALAFASAAPSGSSGGSSSSGSSGGSSSSGSSGGSAAIAGSTPTDKPLARPYEPPPANASWKGWCLRADPCPLHMVTHVPNGSLRSAGGTHRAAQTLWTSHAASSLRSQLRSLVLPSSPACGKVPPSRSAAPCRAAARAACSAHPPPVRSAQTAPSSSQRSSPLSTRRSPRRSPRRR